MKQIIKVKLEQEDIDNGIRMSSQGCPIALRLSKMFPDASIVVGLNLAGIMNRNDVCYNNFYIPKVGQDFISNFDRNEPVDLIEFELEKDN